MYHSDYESDFEGRIPVRWKSCHSDTEDTVAGFRVVKPRLKTNSSRRQPERKVSPPCPHQWESHEDIELLEKEMKKKRPLVSSTVIKKENLTTKIESVQTLQHQETVSKSVPVNVQPARPEVRITKAATAITIGQETEQPAAMQAKEDEDTLNNEITREVRHWASKRMAESDKTTTSCPQAKPASDNDYKQISSNSNTSALMYTDTSERSEKYSSRTWQAKAVERPEQYYEATTKHSR